MWRDLHDVQAYVPLSWDRIEIVAMFPPHQYDPSSLLPSSDCKTWTFIYRPYSFSCLFSETGPYTNIQEPSPQVDIHTFAALNFSEKLLDVFLDSDEPPSNRILFTTFMSSRDNFAN